MGRRGGSRSDAPSMPDRHEVCQLASRGVLARQLVFWEQDGVSGGDPEFDGRPFLIDAGRAFAAMHHLAGGKLHGIEIF